MQNVPRENKPLDEGKLPDPRVSGLERLRGRAEEKVREDVARLRRNGGVDHAALIHELEVHEAELLIQNEELLRTQSELARSQRKYLDLFDFAPLGYLTLSAQNLILDANLAAAELLGVRRAGLIGSKLGPHVRPDEEGRFYEHLARARKEPTRQVTTLRMHRGEREEFWAQLTTMAVKDDAGGQGQLRIAIADVTERQRTEAAQNLNRRILETCNRYMLRKPVLEELVREIRDFTRCEAVGIRILDQQGKIPYEAYVGFRREFYEKESPLSVKNDQCMCINVIRGTTNPGLPFYTPGGSFFMNGTTRFLATVSEREKGSTRNACNQQGYESVALVPIRTHGNILGLIHLADAREDRVPLELVETLEKVVLPLAVAVQRVQVEEALRESEARLELFFAQSLDGFFFMMLEEPVRWDDTVDKDQVIEYVFDHQRVTMANAAMTSQYGAAPEQFVGLTPRDFWKHDLPTGKRIWREFFDQGQLHIETCERRLDGTPIWIDGDYICIRDGQGRITGHFGVQRDITARKQAEQRLLDYQNKLRELAAKLTLAEEQERRRIAVGVHDQIGQRLALLKLALRSFSASAADPSLRPPIADICKEVDCLINDAHLLTFELSYPVLYEAGFANAVESWLVEQIHDKHGLQYTFEADERLDPLEKNVSVTLFQIVRELLANVVKHAKAQRVEVRLRRAGDKVQITVQDDGVGFEPARVGRPDSRVGGYGLFSMRERLEYLSGNVEIESAPGRGSRITVTVPMRAQPGPGDKEASS